MAELHHTQRAEESHTIKILSTINHHKSHIDKKICQPLTTTRVPRWQKFNQPSTTNHKSHTSQNSANYGSPQEIHTWEVELYQMKIEDLA